MEIMWDMVLQGKFINVNLERKELKVDGKTVIKEGVIKDGYKLEGDNMSISEVLKEVEYLYTNYKYSIPSKKSDSRYFKGVGIDEIPEEMIVFAEERNKAKAKIEVFVLEKLLTGELYWDDKEMGGTWFWQSKVEPELVLLKNWF